MVFSGARAEGGEVGELGSVAAGELRWSEQAGGSGLDVGEYGSSRTALDGVDVPGSHGRWAVSARAVSVRAGMVSISDDAPRGDAFSVPTEVHKNRARRLPVSTGRGMAPSLSRFEAHGILSA